MQAKRLGKGGTIGIFCPCHVADRDRYERVRYVIERLGFRVKFGKNFYKDGWGYAASAEERAEDLNELVADDGVGMILFSGGEGGAEILRHIDYENVRRHPKLFSSYSDGTSILSAINAKTGLVTYYGWGAGEFREPSLYDYKQFLAHFVEGYSADEFVRDSEWTVIRGGSCEGTIIGGYAQLAALVLTGKFYDHSGKDYILMLEDHERFILPAVLAEGLAFLELSGFMDHVRGAVFGHYSENPPETLFQILKRFGDRNNIPVVYTDDFGHGSRHGIFPLGIKARLDAEGQTLRFLGE
jgi:muramoyltetrapeptide carboxypeptidase